MGHSDADARALARLHRALLPPGEHCYLAVVTSTIAALDEPEDQRLMHEIWRARLVEKCFMRYATVVVRLDLRQF